MTVIPLGSDDIESKDENAQRIRLENMYLIDSPYSPDGISRVSRPTLTQVAQISDGPINGFFQDEGVFDGLWFIVSGDTLYSYDPMAKTLVSIGNVPGTEYCEFAGGTLSTGDRILVLRNGVVYSWNGTVLNTVNMPNQENVGSICYLDSYYFLSVTGMETEAGRFYWISPGLVDPDPLDFATAERLPDDLVSVSLIGDELWLIGTSSTEVWTASGNADSPFQRVSGRAYTYGCAESLTTVASKSSGYPCLLWVSDTRVVVMAQGSPSRVSNDSVDEILRGATNLRAWGFEYNRHNFYVVTSDQATLVYDITKQRWSRWSTYMADNWFAHLGIQSGSEVYAGDYTNGNIYQLVEGTDDAGSPVVRTASGLVTTSENYMNCFRVNVIMNSGWTQNYGPSAVLELCWSDDLGSTWTDYVQLPMGETGQYKTDVTYSGLGMIRRPGRLFKFRFSDMSRFRLDYATMNEA